MLWIALAAATQISAPVERYVWLGLDDTPVERLPARGHVDLRLRLTIAPNGRVHRCEADRSSGDAWIDRYTCDLARRRALYQPARSASGEAMYGVTHQSVIWARGAVDAKRNADLVAKPGSFPKAAHSPVFVKVKFAVDAEGQVSMCSAMSDARGNNPSWAPAACNEVISQSPARPAIDDAGHPVPSIQDASVEFVN